MTVSYFSYVLMNGANTIRRILSLLCKKKNSFLHAGVIVALRKLEKNASSDEVRKKAAGALCMLENRDQNGEKLHSLGLYRLLSAGRFEKVTYIKLCSFARLNTLVNSIIFASLYKV